MYFSIVDELSPNFRFNWIETRMFTFSTFETLMCNFIIVAKIAENNVIWRGFVLIFSICDWLWPNKMINIILFYRISVYRCIDNSKSTLAHLKRCTTSEFRIFFYSFLESYFAWLIPFNSKDHTHYAQSR